MLIVNGVSKEAIQSLTVNEAEGLYNSYLAGLWGQFGHLIVGYQVTSHLHNIQQIFAEKGKQKKAPDFATVYPDAAKLLGIEQKKTVLTVENY